MPTFVLGNCHNNAGAWLVFAPPVSCSLVIGFVVLGVLGYSTKYYHKLLWLVRVCTVCTTYYIHRNPFHTNGCELKRMVFVGVFPIETS